MRLPILQRLASGDVLIADGATGTMLLEAGLPTGMPGEAWVLETADRYWAAKKVEDAYSISNILTIGTDYDLASPGLVEHAVKKGWCRGEADFHFARCYRDFLYTLLGAGKPRLTRTRACLQAGRSDISVRTMCAALRDHGPGSPKSEGVRARGAGAEGDDKGLRALRCEKTRQSGIDRDFLGSKSVHDLCRCLSRGSGAVRAAGCPVISGVSILRG